MSDKTEDATPRRLRRARAEGDSGASAAASQAVAFVAAVALAPWVVRALVARTAADLRAAVAGGANLGTTSLNAGSLNTASALLDPQALATTSLALLLPALLVVALAGGVAQALQTGGTFAAGRIAPRLNRLDVVAGLGNLVSGARVFAVVRSLVAAALLGWLAVHDVGNRVVDLARVAGRLPWAGVVVSDVAQTFAWHAAALGLVLGLLDLLVTRSTWLGRLRMTKEEVRREHREAEGDPVVRAARHRLHQEILVQAAIAAVRSATVVVTNPTHLACALRYDGYDGSDEKAGGGGDEAPVVVASGEGDVAARIARAAEAWGIPVVRDVPLARALIELGVGDAIPEVLYEAVAEILRELWQAEQE
ncbi:MAG TPA: EscU/YscU/HrcU family type III secretion system export apparatus switch protein [Polyangiaceae bacterium]|nr:EscU/YscU/HrcU family type III secretion system export apparatus switch protein [Polyangiaceae bacterium]